MSRRVRFLGLALGVVIPFSVSSQSVETRSAQYSSLANFWQLSDDEKGRLEQLILIEKPFSDVENLTPFELLGKYAESDDDRVRYAIAYTKAMSEHQTRSLAWAATVATVAKENEASLQDAIRNNSVIRAYMNELGFDISSGSAALTRRWHLHVSSDDCDDTCRSMLDATLNAVNNAEIEGFDLIFVDMTTPDLDRGEAWFEAQALDIQLLETGALTVNYNNPEWEIDRAGREVPLLVDRETGDEVRF